MYQYHHHQQLDVSPSNTSLFHATFIYLNPHIFLITSTYLLSNYILIYSMIFIGLSSIPLHFIGYHSSTYSSNLRDLIIDISISPLYPLSFFSPTYIFSLNFSVLLRTYINSWLNEWNGLRTSSCYSMLSNFTSIRHNWQNTMIRNSFKRRHFSFKNDIHESK